ncbi:MAG: nucleoside phosphorylase [Saprospiraceae bacterium]|nr:nucleoside phosphorylase [Saprospiraceae bacterium]
MPKFAPSELVLNSDGSIYHLHLHPEQIADTILTVGDPGRVEKISRNFDTVEHRVAKREFVTHTGYIGRKRLSVISTGIGPDNIDIVVNELDALANIDLKTRTLKDKHTSLTLIRVGTSGAIQPDLEVGSFVVSSFGIGLDNLLYFYDWQHNLAEAEMQDAFYDYLRETGALPVRPYLFGGNPNVVQALSANMQPGITLTSPGFYGPQGRQLRAPSRLSSGAIERLSHFAFNGHRITNFEMETAAIYGLCRILGHRAASCNVLLANRSRNTFTDDPGAVVKKLIEEVLARVVEMD